ncbi:ABC transporter permease [Thermomonospora amylolytica]|uniref:ABC transporter permease n=1 Tax=Thermomonospora amylolytica TaxID=1411117 RepID=UPI001F3B7C11|nr:ABC transporter permease [Thermomonospora amylolytica]
MIASTIVAVRWALADAWALARRGLVHWVRNPGMVAGVLAYPAVMVLLFGYVLGSAIQVAGGGDYREFLMPGMFAQTMAMGVVSTMIVVAADAAHGVTDRLRVLPVSRAAPLLGRCLADMVNGTLELAILAGCALVAGWSWHRGPAAALAAVGLLLALRLAMVWLGIWLGLGLSPQGAQAAWMPVLPVTFLSATFVSPAQLPGWLEPVAAWNPLSATVTACRDLFGNPGVAGDGWAARHALELAVAWPVVIIAVCAPLAVRRYRRLDR